MGVNTFSPNSSQGFVMTHSQLLGTFETFFILISIIYKHC